MSRLAPNLRRWWAAWLLFGVLALMSLYPFVFVTFTAFKTKRAYAQDPVGPPWEPTLEYLERALTTGNMLGYLANSLIVVVAAVLLLLVIASMAGYALSILKFRGSNLILLGIVCLLAVPAAVVMIPIYRTVSQLGLLNSHLGLTLTYTALQLPFSIYLMTNYYNGLPREIIEAAQMDGAGHLHLFRTIALPLAIPALSAMATLNFLWLFNELLFGLLIMQGTRCGRCRRARNAARPEHDTGAAARLGAADFARARVGGVLYRATRAGARADGGGGQVIDRAAMSANRPLYDVIYEVLRDHLAKAVPARAGDRRGRSGTSLCDEPHSRRSSAQAVAGRRAAQRLQWPRLSRRKRRQHGTDPA